MTPQELREAVYANPDCAPALEARDLDALATILSNDCKRPSDTKIGNGTVLDVLGMVAGTTLLRHIATAIEFEFVRPLLEQGRLEIGKPSAQLAIQGLALQGVITQGAADALCALGWTTSTVGRLEVEAALFNPDGSLKEPPQ